MKKSETMLCLLLIGMYLSLSIMIVLNDEKPQYVQYLLIIFGMRIGFLLDELLEISKN